jgi:glycosyltransferase involved in cell wall biosynthesis
MRIIHIISGDLWAGAEVQVYQCINGLKAIASIETFCILFNHGQLENALKRLGANVAVFDEKVINTSRIIGKTRQALISFKPDVIHVHHIKEHYVAFIARFLIGKKIPIVRTVHGLNAVSLKLPFIRKLRSTIVVKLDTVLKKFCTTVLIAVSKKLENDLNSISPTGEVVQIYNALNLADFHFDRDMIIETRKKYNAEHVFWIGTAVRLVKPKNIEMLINAGHFLAKKRLPFKISIFGDGPRKKELAAQIERNKLNDKVILHGFKKDLKKEMASLDVFVLCSLHEGLPMALLEAMALGSLVVCTAVGGMKEIIDNEHNGILVPSQNASELARALIKIKESEDQFTQLRINAKHTVKRHFNIEKATESLHRLYLSLNSIIDKE